MRPWNGFRQTQCMEVPTNNFDDDTVTRPSIQFPRLASCSGSTDLATGLSPWISQFQHNINGNAQYDLEFVLA